MRTETIYRAVDGRRFDSEDECRAYEESQGHAGAIAEYLDHARYRGRTRTTVRRALAGYLAWAEGPLVEGAWVGQERKLLEAKDCFVRAKLEGQAEG